jgi:hypothetical protein
VGRWALAQPAQTKTRKSRQGWVSTERSLSNAELGLTGRLSWMSAWNVRASDGRLLHGGEQFQMSLIVVVPSC